MKEALYRLWLFVLMVGLLLLVGSEVFGEEQSKTPPPVSIKVVPRAVVPNEYRPTSFYVVWTIERHPDNQSFTLTYDCGEYHSSKRDMEGEDAARIASRNLEILVTAKCVFEICVTRILDNVKCAKQEIVVLRGEPP